MASMHANPCPAVVECVELTDYLPCALGAGHSRPHAYDTETWRAAVVERVKKYRRALEQIAAGVGFPLIEDRQIARKVLSDARS